MTEQWDTEGSWTDAPLLQPLDEEIHEGCLRSLHGAGALEKDENQLEGHGLLIKLGHSKDACALCFVGLCMTMDVARAEFDIPHANPEVAGLLEEFDTDWTFRYYIIHLAKATAHGLPHVTSTWVCSRAFNAKCSDLDPKNPPSNVRALVPESNIPGYTVHKQCFDLLEQFWVMKGYQGRSDDISLEDILGRYLSKEVFVDDTVPWGTWGCGFFTGLHLYATAWQGRLSLDDHTLTRDRALRINSQLQFFLQAPNSNQYTRQMITAAESVVDQSTYTTPGMVKAGELCRRYLQPNSQVTDLITTCAFRDALEPMINYLPSDILPYQKYVSTVPAQQPLDDVLLYETPKAFMRSRLMADIELSHIDQDGRNQLESTTACHRMEMFAKLLAKSNKKRMVLLYSYKGLVDHALSFEKQIQNNNLTQHQVTTAVWSGQATTAAAFIIISAVVIFADRVLLFALICITVMVIKPRIVRDQMRIDNVVNTSSSRVLAKDVPRYTQLWYHNLTAYYETLRQGLPGPTVSLDTTHKLGTVCTILPDQDIAQICLAYKSHISFDSDGKASHYPATGFLCGLSFELISGSRIEIGDCNGSVHHTVNALVREADAGDDVAFDLYPAVGFPGYVWYGDCRNELDVQSVCIKSSNRRAIKLDAMLTNTGHIAALNIFYEALDRDDLMKHVGP